MNNLRPTLPKLLTALDDTALAEKYRTTVAPISGLCYREMLMHLTQQRLAWRANSNHRAGATEYYVAVFEGPGHWEGVAATFERALAIALIWRAEQKRMRLAA